MAAPEMPLLHISCKAMSVGVLWLINRMEGLTVSRPKAGIDSLAM